MSKTAERHSEEEECAAILVDRGELDYGARMTDYWPEFAAAGKEKLPVRYLLSHQAGLPAVEKPLPEDSHCNWELITEALGTVVQSDGLQFPRGGYVVTRGRGRVIVTRAKG